MKRMNTLIVVAILVAWTAPVMAQKQTDPSAHVNGKGKVILSWDEFVKITNFDPGKKPEAKQTLTIPWAEVEKLLGIKVEKVGKATVDLPWQEFKLLLEWSVKQKTPKPDVPPPADFIITSSQYTGDLSANGAKFILKTTLAVLRKDGWKRIPLLPASVAVTSVDLPEGVFLNSNKGRYELLTKKTGKIDVTVEFSVAVTISGGIHRVGFQPISVSSAVLDLTVDRADADVKVPGAQSLVVKPANGKTKVAAAIPAGRSVNVTWERALPKVAAAPTKLYAETRTLIAVTEGALMGSETVYFNILHTPVRELKLTVPAGVSVLNVSGNNVQNWRVEQEQLRVVLRADTIGAYTLRISYERAVKDSADVPVLRAEGVEREKGFIGVIALANVEITSGKVVGATEIDVRQLPPDIAAMTNQPILLAFRYMGDKLTIPLAIKRHGEVGVLVTIIDSGLFTVMQLNDGRRMTKVVYSVRNNRNQFLRMKMPAGAEIWSAAVRGNPVSPAKDEQGNILIPLVRSGQGARELVSFPVELVYVETPKKPAADSGRLHVTLPTAVAVPAIHLMVNFYAPAEGNYTVGWGGSGFTGPLRLVESFTSLAAGPGATIIKRNAARQAARMQKQFDARADAISRITGATPIRVKLPIKGTLFKLEKILAMPGDRLFFDVRYRDWKVAK